MADTGSTTDRIEKQIEINAPLARVWEALTDHEQFGQWFRAKMDRPFAPGATVIGEILVKGFEGLAMEIVIDRIEPPHHFSYFWHPYAVDPAYDYSQEEPTLVTFTLAETDAGGTRLTVVESGFDKIPAERRDEAFRMNSGGWKGQTGNIKAYVEAPAGGGA